MITEDLAIWVGLGFAGLLILLIVVPTLWTGAPPTPSGRAVRACVADALRDLDLPEGGIVDLGSGWGGMARKLARTFPDRKVTGIEASFLPWLVSAAVQRLVGPGNLRFRYGDFRKGTLDDAAVTVCYLGPSLSGDVVTMLRKAGTPGCLAVSCFFALPGLVQADQRTARDLYRTPVYIYRV